MCKCTSGPEIALNKLARIHCGFSHILLNNPLIPADIVSSSPIIHPCFLIHFLSYISPLFLSFLSFFLISLSCFESLPLSLSVSLFSFSVIFLSLSFYACVSPLSFLSISGLSLFSLSLSHNCMYERKSINPIKQAYLHHFGWERRER